MRRDRTGEPIDDDDQPPDNDTEPPPAMTPDQAKAHIRRILNADQRGGPT